VVKAWNVCTHPKRDVADGRVHPRLVDQLRTSHRIDPDLVTIMPATDTPLDSTRRAYDQARTWVADQSLNEHEPAPHAGAKSSSPAVRRTVNGSG
jgi:hypothetical protein